MLTKIAVLVSGNGTNLQALIDAEKNGKLENCQLALVIANNPNAYALKRAAEHNIMHFVISRKTYKTSLEYEEAMQNLLLEYKIDLIVLAGFMSILSPQFIQMFPNRIINIHPSLIPSFCGNGYYGIKVHQAVLKYGVQITGATVHYVNEIIDGGKIILQKSVMVQPLDTPESLQKRVLEEAEWVILPKAVTLVAQELKKEKQDD